METVKSETRKKKTVDFISKRTKVYTCNTLFARSLSCLLHNYSLTFQSKVKE